MLLKKILKTVLFGIFVLPQLATADIAIQPGLSGTWIVEDDGQGAFINIADVDGESVFVVSFYSYLNGQQVWMIGSKSFQENDVSITLPVETTDNAEFGVDFFNHDVRKTNWGNLSLRFSSCDAGTMEYNSTLSGFGSGSLSLIRLTNTMGLDCQNISIDTPTFEPPILSDPPASTVQACIDNVSQELCLEVGKDPEFSSSFVNGLSCEILFPQDIYLPDLDPSLKDTCFDGFFFPCGTCRVSDADLGHSKAKLKTININPGIDIDLIGNIIRTKLLQLEE